MIRTLVVDDDFRVAGIHAARVARIDGFECVGEVYSAAAAREAIARLNPELLLLDVHLPDEDGLSLLRSLQAAGTQVDCIIITAARDLATVKSAMSSGAVHYLVKPFSFERAPHHSWRPTSNGVRNWSPLRPPSQATIDSLYNVALGPGSTARGAGGRACSQPCKKPSTPSGPPQTRRRRGIAGKLGVSRPTAQRYLGALERKGLLVLDLTYGGTGRPLNSYTIP